MKTSGFSLIELLVALCITAMLTLVAIPSFVDLMQRYSLRSAAWELFHSINSARATAIDRNTTISLWNLDGRWDTGAEMFVDTNSNGSREQSEDILLVLGAKANLEITGNHWVSSYISYYPDGTARSASGAFQVGTLTICRAGEADGYALVLSIGGRLRIQQRQGNCR